MAIVPEQWHERWHRSSYKAPRRSTSIHIYPHLPDHLGGHFRRSPMFCNETVVNCDNCRTCPGRLRQRGPAAQPCHKGWCIDTKTDTATWQWRNNLNILEPWLMTWTKWTKTASVTIMCGTWCDMVWCGKTACRAACLARSLFHVADDLLQLSNPPVLVCWPPAMSNGSNQHMKHRFCSNKLRLRKDLSKTPCLISPACNEPVELNQDILRHPTRHPIRHPSIPQTVSRANFRNVPADSVSSK